ncbi:hypothetical protein [Massilia yuzhufengensis]|uniref:Uncharacterized protein n=1 Tax=Massilia yuzhufengensis TaxID=1164594 RepID=A0A1I1NZ23_9BURK|nr:hypothetical protein [Massilia yuzhufengensis]SFD02931.1 hypothetical protein SAMN05216204_11499 [Massilia yuzhufengensis]
MPHPVPRPFTRAMAVQGMRARLLRESFPRIQMFILVTITGLAGFGASVALLAGGIEVMALRYVLAMGVAYIVFLLLLWLWLHTRTADYLDIPASAGSDGGGGGSGASDFAGGGGSFDGGGASGNVDFAPDGAGIEAIAEKPLAVIGHADEGAIPLALVLIALGIVLSSLFVVWSAPILFAEILVDALLAAGLYRRLRVLDPRHWMVAALKRTLIPFILTTLVVAGAGWGMQAYAPEARSLGQVFASQ